MPVNFTSQANRKPCFNKECRRLRREFYNTKTRHRKSQTEITYKFMKRKSKCYKRCLAQAKYRHQNEFISKLRQLKCKNPKKYWDAMNNELKSENSQGPVPVSLNDLL